MMGGGNTMKISKAMLIDIVLFVSLLYGNYLVLDWQWSNIKSFISGGVIGAWVAVRILYWRS